MKSLTIARSGLIALVAIAMPGIACFGYYTLEAYGDISGSMATLLVLAYPAALLGCVWLAMVMFSPRRSTSHLLLAILCLVVPVGFLLLARA